MFADDTNLLIQGSSLESLSRSLNAELEKVNDFFKANKLKLNAKKTKMVHFCKKLQPESKDQLIVFLDGEKLSYDSDAIFLGITIDSNLNWEKHCANVANKISRNNAVINRVKNVLPFSSLKLLYNSFIQSHLLYGLPAWGGANNLNKKRMISIHKRALRTICKSKYASHTEPRMKQTAILKFEDLYNQHCLTLMHDCILDNAPEQVSKLLIKGPNERFTLRNQINKLEALKAPVMKSKVGTSSIRVKGPSLWNKIPSDLKKINKKHIFKRKLKSAYLAGYASKVECTNPRCGDIHHHKK